MIERTESKTVQVVCAVGLVLSMSLSLSGCVNQLREAFWSNREQAPRESDLAKDWTYRVGPGDELNIFVWRNPELTQTVTVRPDGKFSTRASDKLRQVSRDEVFTVLLTRRVCLRRTVIPPAVQFGILASPVQYRASARVAGVLPENRAHQQIQCHPRFGGTRRRRMQSMGRIDRADARLVHVRADVRPECDLPHIDDYR